MNFKQLEYFVHVAELGSFSKAALVLDIAQPALSRQVRALEIDLREMLLLRNGRGVVLTDAGQRLYEHSVNILQALSHAQDDMGANRDAPVGRITIGLPPSVGRQLTLPLIDGFQRRLPTARLAIARLPTARLAIVEGMSSHISEWISTGRVVWPRRAACQRGGSVGPCPPAAGAATGRAATQQHVVPGRVSAQKAQPFDAPDHPAVERTGAQPAPGHGSTVSTRLTPARPGWALQGRNPTPSHAELI